MNTPWSKVVGAARDGSRVLLHTPEGKKKTLWAGLGNRSGLHSFQFTLLKEKWEKSGARFEKKLNALTEGTIEVQEFVNINRDRGRWVKRFTKEI